MINYILRRILYAIPIAFGVSVVCFSLVYLAPGDPLQTILYQKWVAECELDGFEAYSDYRRTGFPVIAQVSADRKSVV